MSSSYYSSWQISEGHHPPSQSYMEGAVPRAVFERASEMFQIMYKICIYIGANREKLN